MGRLPDTFKVGTYILLECRNVVVLTAIIERLPKYYDIHKVCYYDTNFEIFKKENGCPIQTEIWYLTPLVK